MTDSLLIEYFDNLLVTPENVKQLNYAILELAVRGKLTHREVGDEPARELLKRIRANIDNIVEDGKKRRIDVMPPISDNEKQFELPDGWEWARIGDVAYGYRGHNPIKDEFIYKPKDGYIRFVQITDFKTEERAVYVPVSPQNKMIYKGEIIMAAYRHIGKLSREMEGAFNVALCKVMELPPMSRDYLEKIIGTSFVKGELLKASGRAHIPSMHLDHFLSLVIPLPPLAEQNRIIARMEELFAQTRALAKELAHSQIELDGLNQSALSHLLASETPEEFNQHWDFIAEHFDLLFQMPEHVTPLRQSILELAVRGKLTRREVGDESAGELLKRFQMEKEKNGSVEKLAPIKENEKTFELPDGWEWAKLNDLVISFANGIYKQDTFYADDGVACLRMYNISNGVLNFEKLKRITLTQEELQTYKLEKGDLLVNRVNSRELVGKTAVIGDYDEPLIYESKNIRVKLFEKNTLPYFLNYLFMLPIIKKVFTKDAKQTTGQASINQVQLKNLVVPIPPLAEQERIVKRVEQLLSLCDALEGRLQSAEEERGRLVAAVMSTVGG